MTFEEAIKIVNANGCIVVKKENHLQKERVSEVIDKCLPLPGVKVARQCGKTWLLSYLFDCRTKLKRELGLK